MAYTRLAGLYGPDPIASPPTTAPPTSVPDEPANPLKTLLIILAIPLAFMITGEDK